jgi:internalin A
MTKKQQIQQKPKEILELERFYNIEIHPEGETRRDLSTFFLNDDGFVRALNLINVPISDPTPIIALKHLDSLRLHPLIQDFGFFREMSLLKSLSISLDKDVTPIWPQGLKLTSLTIYGHDGIGDFDFSVLSTFTLLQRVSVSFCQLNNLSLVADLAQLRLLDLWYCFSDSWKDLRWAGGLEYLSIQSSQLEDIGFIAHNPACIEELNLDDNQIADISSIAKLPSLTHLSLSGNHIVSIASLSGLNQLRNVWLSRNRIEDCSPLSGLNALEVLGLNNNELKNVPPSLVTRFSQIFGDGSLITSAGGLHLAGNPISAPPMDVVEQGRQAILNWFEEQKKGMRPLNEVRVMLIGPGSAGKTSLMHRLTHDGYSDNEETTHGINLETWLVKDDERTVKVNLWDFGGQQMQHSVHKFFLSNACLYVLVADNRKEDDPQYWLEHIRTLAKNAQVLVVYNKTDQNPDEVLGRKTLQDRYPNIIGFHNVSCRTGYGLQDLRSTLESLVLSSESASKEYPLSWFNVKQQLEAATGDGRHHISYRAYEVICEEQGITDSTSQRSLLGVLSAIGTISFFDDADLDRLQILNPEWVTEGVYRIVTDDRVGKRRGDITSNDLPSLLRPKMEGDFEYKKEHYPFLLALMKKFEVCQVRDDGHILIPARFSLEPKANYADYRGKDARLYFLYYKSFLPLSIIHRFITRHLNYAINEDYWYRGIVIKDPTSNTEAFVELNESERRIYLWLKGDDIIGYWGYLRRELQGLSDFFSGIEYDEYVAIDEENRGKLWIKYGNLRRTLSRGLSSYYDPSLDRDIDVIKYLSIFDGSKILNDYRKGFRKGQLQSTMDSVNVNISPQFHMSQSQHQETRVDVKVQQISDDIIEKLSVLMQENGDVVAQNRLCQVKEATEALEREADPRNAKRSGMLDRYAHFLNQLKQGGEWVNTINDASKNLPQLTQRMSNLLEHFQSLLA